MKSTHHAQGTAVCLLTVAFRCYNFVMYISKDMGSLLAIEVVQKIKWRQLTTKPTSEDTDQPAYPRSLIRVFAGHMCLLQPPGYRKKNDQEPLLYWADV